MALFFAKNTPLNIVDFHQPRQGLRLWFNNISSDRLLPIPKNTPELKPDERIGHFSQGPERQAVLHLILNEGSALLLLEAMGVDPELVGTAELLIPELPGWVPVGDPALPADGKATQPQLILEECPLSEAKGLRSEELNPELWRGKAL
jgi:hypothetical protein